MLVPRNTQRPENASLGLTSTEKIDISLLFKKLANYNGSPDSSPIPSKNQTQVKQTLNLSKPGILLANMTMRKSNFPSPTNTFRGNVLPQVTTYSEGFKTMKAIDSSYSFANPPRIITEVEWDRTMNNTFYLKTTSSSRPFTIKSLSKSPKSLRTARKFDQSRSLANLKSIGVHQHAVVNPGQQNIKLNDIQHKIYRSKTHLHGSLQKMKEFQERYRMTLNSRKLPKLLTISKK